MDYLSFKETKLRIQHFVQDTQSSLHEVVIEEIINNAYVDVASRFSWRELNRVDRMPAALAVGAQFFRLPIRARILKHVCRGNDGEEMRYYSPQNLLQGSAQWENTQGFPVGYTDVGSYAQASLVITAEKVIVAGGDVRLRGVTGGIEAEESILDGGTSANTYGTGLSLLAISTDQAAMPSDPSPRLVDIVVTGQTSGTVYLRIRPRMFTERIAWYKLLPLSGEAVDLLVAYERDIEPMVNDGDIPDIPVSRYLLEVGIAEFSECMRLKQSAQVHHAKAERILRDIVYARKLREPQINQARPLPGNLLGRRRITTRVNSA